MNLIEVNHASKHFGGLKAVDDVTFHIQKGEILGLIGPNGAGKTTLFNLIAGAFPPTSGTIRFSGEDITACGAREICHKGISRTYQLVRPFSSLSVYENVLVGYQFGKRESVGKDVREKACMELLRMTGLLPKANIAAKALTLVGRKRLEVARALATRPKVLLLDEAISGLNPTETDGMIELIRKIRLNLGVTIFMIEHIMKAVMGLSDRILVLSFGRLIAQGTPQEVSSNKDVIEAYLGAEGVKLKRHAAS